MLFRSKRDAAGLAAHLRHAARRATEQIQEAVNQQAERETEQRRALALERDRQRDQQRRLDRERRDAAGLAAHLRHETIRQDGRIRQAVDLVSLQSRDAIPTAEGSTDRSRRIRVALYGPSLYF